MEAVGQLSGGLAHDFNNILGIIGGNLEMLRPMVADKEKAVRRIETALRNVERAAKLTRRLLNFSRQQPQPNAPVSVNEIIAGMSELLEKSLTINIAVDLHLDEKVCMTKIDAGDFEDVMINLALNARDAMPQGGRIVIETENVQLDEAYVAVNPDTATGPYVRISVSDTGTGMSKETAERIFEPFFTTKPASAGTGLGLSMVYGFVKRSRGHIKVYSEPGQGTTFRIYLPCAPSGEGVELRQGSFETGLQTGSETILVVDDEAELLEIASEQLRQAGYKVVTAGNAEDALKLIDEDASIDLLFSDLVLSFGMNGYELAKEAVRRKPGLRYLLTSGYTQNLLNAKHDGAKPVYFLPKPYSPVELARHIRQALDKPELQS
ncbi:Multi-sensor hybrid histidine kinase (fragment) [Rhodospirillaceae bacterium LM-1]